LWLDTAMIAVQDNADIGAPVLELDMIGQS
jgi:hypothetical protein